VSQCKCAHLSSVLNSGKDVPGGHTRGIINSKENLKVTEHLGGKTVQRRAQREDKIVEDSVKLCRWALSMCKECTKELCFKFCEKRSVQEKTLTELLNTL
jgi:hypothetical protein